MVLNLLVHLSWAAIEKLGLSFFFIMSLNLFVFMKSFLPNFCSVRILSRCRFLVSRLMCCFLLRETPQSRHRSHGRSIVGGAFTHGTNCYMCQSRNVRAPSGKPTCASNLNSLLMIYATKSGPKTKKILKKRFSE